MAALPSGSPARSIDKLERMFDKMMGGVFRKTERRHKDQLVDRTKMLDSSARALVGMAKAMLNARANGTDPLAAIEQTIGWQRLEAMGQSLEAARADNLLRVIDSYPRVHRIADDCSRGGSLPDGVSVARPCRPRRQHL